jgi:hypothetical protein
MKVNVLKNKVNRLLPQFKQSGLGMAMLLITNNLYGRSYSLRLLS